MKRILSIAIVLMLIVSVNPLCGSAGSEEPSNFNKQGYPIVNEKINLHVVVSVSSHYGDFNTMTFWKEVEKVSNIHLDFEIITQNPTEKINLIFASQDYPDLMFNGPNERQIMDAASAGDIVPLNDLIKEYAPNWYAFFQEDDYSRKLATTMPDAKIWSLPLI